MEQQVSGIFVSEHKMANMDMERIVVSDPAIRKILELIRLSKKDQEEAVDALVARTPDWSKIPNEDQIEKIKFVLTSETVLHYLQCIETIRPQVDYVETGIDEEGSIVIYAYYTNLSCEQRRAMKKAISENDKEKMVQALTQMDQLMQEGNIIDLAKKRMEAKQKKSRGKEV